MGSGVSGGQEGKTGIAGSYVTEQTAPNSFNIFSVSTLSNTREGDEALHKRKKLTVSSTFTGCTEIAALKTIEPLLEKREEFSLAAPPRIVTKAKTKSSSGIAGSARRNSRVVPSTGTLGNGRAPQGAVSSASRVRQIASAAVVPPAQTTPEDKRHEGPEVFDRLFNCRGRRIRSNSVAAVKSSDEQLLHQLTEQAKEEGRMPNAPTWQPEIKHEHKSHRDLDDTSRRARNHQELFQMARKRGQTDQRAPVSASSRTVQAVRYDHYRDGMKGSLQAQLTAIEVIPSNPVKAFFEAEQRAIEEKQQPDAPSTPKKEKVASRQSLLKKAVDYAKQTSADSPTKSGSPSKSGSPKKADAWNELLDLITANTNLSAERRQACEQMRLFLFGRVGNEGQRRGRDRERTFYEPVGSQDQILELYKVWKVLDADGSGRVDFQEFKTYVQNLQKEGHNNAHALAAEKAIKSLLSKKSSFTIEDMLRICWPCAAFKDIIKMKLTIEEAESAKRVPSPPVLPQEELDALIENFEYYDADGSGAVTIQEIVDSGMIEADTAQKTMDLFDTDGSGELNVWEFCEMFCRNGFRAYPDAPTATDDDGNRLYWDDMLGWRPMKANDKVEKSRPGGKDVL